MHVVKRSYFHITNIHSKIIYYIYIPTIIQKRSGLISKRRRNIGEPDYLISGSVDAINTFTYGCTDLQPSANHVTTPL